ncbi:HLH transcription factor (PalcA) [Sugiyamaella lignohabitans]|uniref:HLH transcription factor (PalcA) n=1 Tax=Sugiyamaella lignohabitans TaxID=796027 RepID=A0A167DS40_9ASCO|nr:HLH transcription factor (PalcA) [Sugiyamaella lignohabitans]ANB13225.1 HLH transcription factor (PalcA) [Sugiyamaella lignohabitans]
MIPPNEWPYDSVGISPIGGRDNQDPNLMSVDMQSFLEFSSNHGDSPNPANSMSGQHGSDFNDFLFHGYQDQQTGVAGASPAGSVPNDRDSNQNHQQIGSGQLDQGHFSPHYAQQSQQQHSHSLQHHQQQQQQQHHQHQQQQQQQQQHQQNQQHQRQQQQQHHEQQQHHQQNHEQFQSFETDQAQSHVPEQTSSSVNPNDVFRSPAVLASVGNGPNNAVLPSADDINFTPLLSPSVEAPFISQGPPDFSMPASYFSPMNSPGVDMGSSPAIDQQFQSLPSQHQQIQPRPAVTSNNSGSSTSTIRTPASGSSTPTGATPVSSSSSRRSRTTPILGPSNGRTGAGGATTITSGRVAKNSPVIKPVKRKGSQASVSTAPGTANNSSNSTSPADEDSPETIAEFMMPPPPNRARSSITSTSSTTSSASSSSIIEPSTPVTPASLMNLGPGARMNQQFQNSASTEDRLQNAIRTTVNISSRKPSVSSVNSRNGGSATNSPLGTPTTAIMPKPPGSANITPNGGAGTISTGTANSGRQWGSRSSSVSASPVLKPKVYSPGISPQIHPNISTDLSALLASKSNYQNIIEGTHNQLGLSYPDHLSAGLASKKASHKLAEQGRRNRINNALSELAGLISPDAPPNSKADTVESAIVYIKKVQKEVADLKEELAHYKALKKEPAES